MSASVRRLPHPERPATRPQLTASQATEPRDRPVETTPDGSDDATADGADLLHSGWYTTEELSALLGVDPSTLRRWRSATPPQGPPFVRLASRFVLYSIPDTQAWLVSRRVDPAKAA